MPSIVELTCSHRDMKKRCFLDPKHKAHRHLIPTLIGFGYQNLVLDYYDENLQKSGRLFTHAYANYRNVIMTIFLLIVSRRFYTNILIIYSLIMNLLKVSSKMHSIKREQHNSHNQTSKFQIFKSKLSSTQKQYRSKKKERKLQQQQQRNHFLLLFPLLPPPPPEAANPAA